MPFLSVVTACFNEEENVDETYRQVRAVMRVCPRATARPTPTNTSSSTTPPPMGPSGSCAASAPRIHA